MDDTITFLYIRVFVIDLISILITFPGYMFILVVNILDLIKNKRLDISDQLISGISLFLLLHKLEYASVGYISITNRHHTKSQYGLHWILIFYLSLIFCTLLFSTWLSIHFCLKIVNINHKLYIYIQRMFPKMFPWILLLSVFTSVLICAPPALSFEWKQFPNMNNTLQNPNYSFFQVFPIFAFSTLCLFMFFSSALKIILSLHRHIKQIHNNSLGAQIVEAHVTALKTVLTLLAFNLFYFSLFILTVINVQQLPSLVLPIFYALCHILGVPILIQGSSKLQKHLHSFCLNFCSLRKTLTRESAV